MAGNPAAALELGGSPRPDRSAWAMIGGLLLVMTACHGIISAGLPALDTAILADLHIARAALKLRETIFLLSAGVCGLLVGLLTTRVRPAHIVLGGLLLLSATLTAYGHARSIGVIYALYAVLGLCFASSHVVIVVLMVRARFAALRTLATAIALSGTSIGAAIFPGLTVLALEHADWRSVLRFAALVPLALVPLAALLLRAPREAAREEPLCEPSRPPRTGALTGALGHLSRPRLALGLLLLATFGTFFASTAFLLNLFLYLQDIGLDAMKAALGMSLVFVTGLVGKVLVGAAAERWGVNRVWNSQQMLLLAGALLLSLGGAPLALVGLVLLGAGWAGCYVLTQVVIANSFAGPSLGEMTGAFIVFEAISSGLGVWFAGKGYDLFGSYRPGFLVCCALIALAALAAWLFRRLVEAGHPDR
ncbi:MFS transporter [Novosphingobium profundi]|uniref:MFS transporter n=1 Tax=Novosphingobium profundi TaxID=1774954 RepID=UPI001BD93F75|nr:MFS transporter [Novosphingobium profundi]MBT0670194.1 MFS transporter [Novosphingobium profundi]